MQAAAVDTLAASRWAHGFYRWAFVSSKFLQYWQFAFGAALSLPFVLLVWAERWPAWVRISQLIAFLVVQALAAESFLFWPSPRPAWIVLLLAALSLQAALLVVYFRQFWDRLALCAMALLAVGVALETWRFHSHYIAPVIPLAFALVVQALRRACAWNIDGRAPGKILALSLPLLCLAIGAAAATRPPGPLERWATYRAAMQKQLQSLPGSQLVIVHYGPGHDFYEEWVENRANLQRAKVLWARDGGREENCQLIKAYPGRTVWRLDADRNQLEKYPPDCAGSKPAPASSVPVLESLPEP